MYDIAVTMEEHTLATATTSGREEDETETKQKSATILHPGRDAAAAAFLRRVA